MSVIPIDHAATRAALSDASGRTADLVTHIGDPGRNASGLAWTLGETAAHILIGIRGYTAAVAGQINELRPLIPSPQPYPERMASMTARTLAAEPTRDPAILSRLIREATSAFLEISSGRPEDEPILTPWYGEGSSLSLAAATALLLGEQVIHGYDLARTMGQPWPIDRELALLLLPAPVSMMPIILNPAVARGMQTVFGVHVRGGPAFILSVRDGAATVGALNGSRGRIDCHVSFDAAAFVLVGYGRVGVWSAIARGKIVAYGRRPWLGLGMRNLFYDP